MVGRPTGQSTAATVLTTVAQSLVRHRVRWAIIAAAGFALATWCGSRLAMRQEVSDFLPSGSAPPDTLPLAGHDADRMAVVLERHAPMTATTAGPVLDSLAHDLGALRGIAAVSYRLDRATQRFVTNGLRTRLLLYFTPAELDSLASHLSQPYMERALLGSGPPIPRSALGRALGIERSDPLGVIGPAAARVRALTGAMPVKFVDRYFATPDQQSFFLLITPLHRLATVDSARSMVRAIDSVIRIRTALVPAGAHLSLIGRPPALVSGVAIAVRDVQRVAVATTLVVFLLLVLFLRRVAAPLLMIGTVLYGVVVTSALAWMIYGSISLVSWLFIASLIGFGDEFALYVVAHYWLSAPSEDRAAALASALRRPGPGILLGGLTSAAAFFSLIAISYPIMRQVAWLSTLGLLLILACSFTVLPLALAFTKPGRDSESGWHQWGERAYRVGQHRPRWWIAAWIILVVVSAWLARGLHFDLHPWRLAVRGVPATAQLDTLSQRMGASFAPLTMISRGATLEETLATERAALQQLESLKDRAGIAGIVALSRWTPSPGQQDSDLAYLRVHRDIFDSSRFVDAFRRVAGRMQRPDSLLTQRYAPLVAGYLTSTPTMISLTTLDSAGMGAFVSEHLVHRPDGYLLRSEIYLSQVPWADGVIDQFTRTLARDSNAALRRVTFSGDALRGATRVSVLRRDMFAVMGLALLLTVLVLAVRFRQIDLVLLCLLPLLCGVAAALATMALLHIQLDMMTLAIAPLLIGLGSDDGIHIVDRMERHESAAEVLSDVTAPMVITTVTTIAGFACMGFASFPGVRATGLIAALGLTVCLIASMQLVPMCYGMLRRGAPRTRLAP